jgi:hypothetical protein
MSAPPQTPAVDTAQPAPQAPTEIPFEPTPDEIPSIQPPLTSPSLDTEQEKLVTATEDLIAKQVPNEPSAAPEPQPVPVTTPAAPVPASLPPKSGHSVAPIIIVVLLVIAGIGLAATVYLSQQTKNLKTQLADITQTLQKQTNTLTPTPTPTVFEIVTPSPSASSSSRLATPSATPSLSAITNPLKPLGNASSALRVAINHSPNAQLILIKIDNANDSATAVTKYFFREDLTNKKYFYVSISGTGDPEIIDKQIYVTPDDNIPSLNDAVLSNQTGLELDAVIKLIYSQCSNQSVCATSPTKAQYIKTGTGIIWQVSVYNQGLTNTPLIAQINALTQAVLYKSDGFATMAK